MGTPLYAIDTLLSVPLVLRLGAARGFCGHQKVKGMLSPRRVKPAPVVVMYELRSLRAAKPLVAMRTVEARIKKWRGLVRWTMLAYTSPRSETVVHIVGERHSHVSRRDNLFSSWQRFVSSASRARAAWAACASRWRAVDIASRGCVRVSREKSRRFTPPLYWSQ